MVKVSREFDSGPDFLPRVYVDVICHNLHSCFEQLQTTFCLSSRQSVARFCYALLGGSILPVTEANFQFSGGKSPFAVTTWWLPRKFFLGLEVPLAPFNANASRGFDSGPGILPRVNVDMICHNSHSCFEQLQTTFYLSSRQSGARFCYALLGGSILPVTEANFQFSRGRSSFAVTTWWLPRKFLSGLEVPAAPLNGQNLPGIWLWAGLPPKSLCRYDMSQFALMFWATIDYILPIF